MRYSQTKGRHNSLAFLYECRIVLKHIEAGQNGRLQATQLIRVTHITQLKRIIRRMASDH